MKKIFLTFFAMILLSSLVFAADFVPTNKLDIDVPDFVQYDFDGTPVDIPVGIDGTAARAYLIIETTGLAGTKFRVRNGRVGWHTVSGIDTTIYNSTGDDLAVGKKFITWPGVDNDGNAVPEGTYTYYVWAYDFANLFEAVNPMADYDRSLSQNRTLVQTTAQDGTLLPKPWISTVVPGYLSGKTPDSEAAQMWTRWSIGNDPKIAELIETSELILPEGWNHIAGAMGRCPYDPADFSNIYFWTSYEEMTTQKLRKFKLVMNDVAEEMTDWGEDLTYGYETTDHHSGGFDIVADTYLCVPIWLYSKSACNSYLLISTVDGDKVEDIYMEEMDKAAFVQEYGEVLQGGSPNGGMSYMNDTRMVFGSIWCFQSAVDPVRYLESGDYADFFVAINEEGDGFQDKGWSADNPFPDFCYAEDPPWNYCCFGSESGIVLSTTQDGGPTSWTLYAPDFTAVSYCAKAGETEMGTSGIFHLDTGGPYDGLYSRPRAWSDRREGFESTGITYLGGDSDRGTISKTGGVGVAAAAPAEFAVAQNVPNPCNPTTTINYTIPESGNVTVDVFNVAGQKVDTLVNNYLDAGSHSVVWDGSSKSSGVYFYTVTSGEFSKTIKMTLLK